MKLTELPDNQRFHFEAALAGIADAVITTDSSERVVFINPAAQSMTGWTLMEAVGLPLTHVFRPIDSSAASADELIQASLVDQRGFRSAIEYRESKARDGAGNIVGKVVVARDITRRHAAEIALLANTDALFAEKERAQVTLKCIGDAVISTDFRGMVTYLNTVAEIMTGWTQAEASGLALDVVFPLVDAASGHPIPCPTTRAIIENQTVAVESPCVLMRRDGMELAVENSAAPIHDRQGGVIGAVMVAHDVTAARELSSRLARLALHDSLTDLPNRTLFSERMGQAMVRARRAQSSVALLYVDLDGFKQTNDSLGHTMGDLLLKGVAQKLLACVRSSDTVSRLGGDEFVLLLADVHSAADACGCAAKILKLLNAGLPVGDRVLHVSASIGIAMFPDHAADADTLMRHADAAMYRAKYTGRANYQMFSAEASESV